MHAIQTDVHHPCQPAFHEEVAALQVAHQHAHRAVVGQRYQRAMVLVLERPRFTLHDQLLQATSGVLGHLLGRLGPRRDGPLFAFRDQESGIADDEDVFVALGLQGRLHFHLVDAVGGQAVDLTQPVRALHPGRPHQQVGIDGIAFLGYQGLRGGFGHHDTGAHLHAQVLQPLGGGSGNPFAEYRQDARGGFDHVHLQVFAIQLFVAVEVEHGYRMVQFRCQLHAGGAAADDGHGDRLAFVVGVQAGVQEALAKAFRLGAAVHEQAVFTNPGGAEIVALAAGGQHQVIVGQLPFR